MRVLEWMAHNPTQAIAVAVVGWYIDDVVRVIYRWVRR